MLRRVPTHSRCGLIASGIRSGKCGDPAFCSRISLHREILLQKAGSPHFPDLMPEAIRPHREWVGTRLNMFVHAYNTNLVKKEELPKSYEDFLDPKWKGRLGIEAEDVDWFAMVIKEIGEDKGLTLFRAIVARNGLSVRRGHTLLAGLVASGEVPFALTVYNHNAEKLKQRGAPEATK